MHNRVYAIQETQRQRKHGALLQLYKLTLKDNTNEYTVCLFTQFTPTAGPIEGGTNVTITGFNLPLEVGSIDSVTVAGVQCQPSSSDFQPATQ